MFQVGRERVCREMKQIMSISLHRSFSLLPNINRHTKNTILKELGKIEMSLKTILSIIKGFNTYTWCIRWDCFHKFNDGDDVISTTDWTPRTSSFMNFGHA